MRNHNIPLFDDELLEIDEVLDSFAWDLSGYGKTAIRGGFGTSYDGILGEVALNSNQPFSLGTTNNNPGPLSNPYANVANPYPYKVDPSNAVFTLPASLVALWLFHTMIKQPAASLLPSAVETRLTPYLGRFRFGGLRRFGWILPEADTIANSCGDCLSVV